MLGAEISNSTLCFCANSFFIAVSSFNDLKKNVEAALFVNAAILEVVAEQILGLNRVVAEHLDLRSVIKQDLQLVHARTLNGARLLVMI